MHLKSLRLRNFRNYADATIEFSPRLNLFCEKNAQGKTNLLEAISFLSTGRSFRTAQLRDLIMHGAPSFFLEASFEKNSFEETLKIYYDGKTKKIEYNATQLHSFNHLFGILPSVVCSPQDLFSFASSPSQRRRFLNLHFAQIDPLYVYHMTRFHRAMKQRNALLKRKTESTLDCFEKEMSTSSEYLLEKRKKMVEDLQAPIEQFFEEFPEQFDVRYRSTLSSSKSFIEQWKKMRVKELPIGYTILGPHRDDLILQLDQKPMKDFASEGQKRCCISALRFAEFHRLSQMLDEKAILCIDDLGTHMDETRQKLLKKSLASPAQIFVTTPLENPSWEGEVFQIEKGKILN